MFINVLLFLEAKNIQKVLNGYNKKKLFFKEK